MAWTWTGYRYDPVFRFKDKDFFQPGLNQAEARFWRLKIHKEIDRRGTRSSIKFTDEDDDMEGVVLEPTMEMIAEEIDEDDNLDEEIGSQTYKILVEKSDIIPEHNPYSNKTAENSGTLNQYSTPDKQYNTHKQSTNKQYTDKHYSADEQYTDRQYRNTSVSSVDSTRSSSSEVTSKDYQYSHGGYGHGELGGLDKHGKHGGYDEHGGQSGYYGDLGHGGEDRNFPEKVKRVLIKDDQARSQEATYISSKFY